VEVKRAIPPAATSERCVSRRKADVTSFTGASKIEGIPMIIGAVVTNHHKLRKIATKTESGLLTS